MAAHVASLSSLLPGRCCHVTLTLVLKSETEQLTETIMSTCSSVGSSAFSLIVILLKGYQLLPGLVWEEVSIFSVLYWSDVITDKYTHRHFLCCKYIHVELFWLPLETDTTAYLPIMWSSGSSVMSCVAQQGWMLVNMWHRPTFGKLSTWAITPRKQLNHIVGSHY